MDDHPAHIHVTEHDIDVMLERGASANDRAEIAHRVAACSECSQRWSGVIDGDRALRAAFPLPIDVVSTPSLVRRRWPARRILAHAAALVLAAVLGASVPGLWTRFVSARSAEPTYVLLFIGSRAREMPTDEVRAIGQDFRRWSDSLRAEGRLVASGQLAGDAQVVRSPTAAAGSVDVLARMEGYFVIRAADDAAALALARACPYVRYQGHVVVRRRAG
jgi:hypothetical protein